MPSDRIPCSARGLKSQKNGRRCAGVSSSYPSSSLSTFLACGLFLAATSTSALAFTAGETAHRDHRTATARPAPPTYPSVTLPIPSGAQLGMLINTHRHGIRTPMLTGNVSLCPKQYGCGALTVEGKKMLGAMGVYFADTYGVGGKGQQDGSLLNNGDGVLPTNAASPAQRNDPSRNPNNITISVYDPRSVRVVASSRDRAIQSGIGLLEGLYSSVNALNGCGGAVEEDSAANTCTNPGDLIYPLINSDPNDALLYITDVSQAFLVYQQAYNSSLYPYMGNLTLGLFTPAELLAMSAELQLGGGECDANTTGTKPFPPAVGSAVFDPYVCGLDLQDDMKYLFSTRGSAWLAANAPTVYANMAKLDECLNDFTYNYLYGYDADIINKGDVKQSVSSQSGYLGYPLALSIINDMKTAQPTVKRTTAAAGSAVSLLNPMEAQNDGVLRYKGYSAHDMTVVELTMAMGNFTHASIDAPFGVAIFFEVWVTDLVDPTTEPQQKENVETRHIRAFYGYPADVDAGSDYAYQFKPYALVCANKTTLGSSQTRHREEGGDGLFVYEAPNGCPLADFERFIAARGPSSPAGQCYISDEARRLLGCEHTTMLNNAEDSLPIDPTVNPYPTAAQLNRKACYKYRKACPIWACARNSAEDYALIASGSDAVPFVLDQVTNNCVRRFTTEDAEALSQASEKTDQSKKVIYGLVSVMVIAMFGFAGMILLFSVVTRRRKGGDAEEAGDEPEADFLSPTQQGRGKNLLDNESMDSRRE